MSYCRVFRRWRRAYGIIWDVLAYHLGLRLEVDVEIEVALQLEVDPQFQ